MAFLSLECRLVTNYIIEEINKYNEGKMVKDQILLNVNKIQKLLYFCNIEYLKQNEGKPLFKEDFCAWPGGPSIPEVYAQYCLLPNGNMVYQFSQQNKCNFSLSKEIKDIIDKVLEKTKDMDTLDLAEIIRIKNGPWSNNYKIDDAKHEQIIPKEEIYEFYLNKELFSNVQNDIPKTKKLTKNNKV